MRAHAEREALAAYGRLPLAFVGNAGQHDELVRYSAQAGGASFAFTPSEALFSFAKGKEGHTLALRFLGASRRAEPVGRMRLPGKVNYLLGSDPATWRTGLPTFREVVYRDLWPGIDLAFRGDGRALKYELHVDPGADPDKIRLAYRGARRLSLGASDGLSIKTSLGALRDSRPLTYQEVGDRRVLVASGFALHRGSAYGFAIGDYDRRRPLVIDPGLLYSTYLGGGAGDKGGEVAVDSSGNAYVTGRTESSNFPTTPGAFDTSFNGGFADAFVTKLNASGSAVLYSTFLGGSGNDEADGIAVDASGNAHVIGTTSSTNFPTTPGAFDTSFNFGGFDAFVTKLNQTGSGLLYSTYLGGSTGTEQGFGIGVDASSSAYVTGYTNSTNFPTTPGAFDTSHNGAVDAFVTKLNSTGSFLFYSTYLGGSGDDRGRGIAVDSSGAYVTGPTESSNFPATPGAFDTTYNSGGSDAFVTKLHTTGSTLAYSTYLGGTSFDQGLGVAVDPAGSAYVTGLTSGGFPTTSGAFDTTYNGNNDAFVTKLDAAGSALAYSTYLGGVFADDGFGVAVEPAGSAYVTGQTDSPGFPTTPGAFDATFNGGLRDAFVTRLNAAGTGLVYSTYLGGNSLDQGFGIAFDAAGSAYVAGQTSSTNFPTTPGGFDTSHNGSGDAFVAKLATAAAPASLVLSPAAATNPVGTSHTVIATVRDAVGSPVSGVTVRFSVAGANTASGFDVTDANGEATFTYTGTAAGTDSISAFADTDDDGTQDVGEPSDTATKVWTPGPPATLTLAPPADTNTVGETHCVTATVRDAFGNSVPGVVVRFSVPTALATAASPASGSDVTDANGQASFCYSAALPGQDTIHAFADTDNDNMQDAGEPFAEATKTWTLPPSTAFCEVTITEGGWIVAMNGDRASLGGDARVRGDGSVEGQEEYQDHGPAQPRHVHSIELTAMTCSDDLTSASIFGTATIDGSGSFVFRIDVTDQGEPGSSDSYGIALSDGYVSGQQQLQGGNVLIHQSS